MNTREKLRSDSLNLLRFPLAIVVLIVHVFNNEQTLSVQGHEYDLSTLPWFMGVSHFVDGFLRGQSTNVYFFISGYVFFLGVAALTRKVYQKKLYNRVKTLLIPYIIWNLIALLIVLFGRMYAPSLFPAAELDYSCAAFLNTFWDASHGMFVPIAANEATVAASMYPQNMALWFVRDLMIVVICTPIIFYLLKRIRQYFIYLLGIAWLALGIWFFGRVNQLLSAFFFFSWGAYMSISNKNMLAEFGRCSKLSAILYISFSLLHIVAACWMPDLCAIIKRFNAIWGLLFFYNLSVWLLNRKICKPNAFLASASFFIYVSHGLICNKIQKALFLVFPPSSDLGVLFVYVAVVPLTIAILLSTFWLLRRYAPAFLKVIAGRK
ncbi:MAG: acyltransferase [Prevotellaceae bacterium]|nr:acyltransferase [Prevotellaceae bacterium]